MLSLSDTIPHRDVMGGSTNILEGDILVITLSDINNIAEKTKDMGTSRKSKEVKKNNDQNIQENVIPKKEKKTKDKSVSDKADTEAGKKSSDSGKKKKDKISTKRKGKMATQIVKAETFNGSIEGENVIVNLLLLKDEEKEKNIHLSTPSRTPINYASTADYFRHIKDARLTFLQAADCAGDLLLRGEVEGDVEAWEEYCRQKTEDVMRWRRRCEESHRARAKESRQVEEGQESCSFIFRKFGRLAKAWLWEQFVDIFPCYVTE